MVDRVSDALQRAANLGIDNDADFPSYGKIPIYLRNPELLSTVQWLTGAKIVARFDDLVDSTIRNLPGHRRKATQFAPPPKLKDPPGKKGTKAGGYAYVWRR